MKGDSFVGCGVYNKIHIVPPKYATMCQPQRTNVRYLHCVSASFPIRFFDIKKANSPHSHTHTHIHYICKFLFAKEIKNTFSSNNMYRAGLCIILRIRVNAVSKDAKMSLNNNKNVAYLCVCACACTR